MAITQASINQKFIAIGANRNPCASDWDVHSNLIAYGAGNVIAIWRPEETSARRSGVIATLRGHTATVNAVKFTNGLENQSGSLLLSAGTDKQLRVWRSVILPGGVEDDVLFETIGTGQGHEGSIADIAVEKGTHRDSQNGSHEHRILIATASSDGTVRIWTMGRKIDTEGLPQDDEGRIRCMQVITTKPKFFPLTVALAQLPGSARWVLAVAGSATVIQIYTSKDSASDFLLSATLTGHENWVRSLDFTRDPSSSQEDGYDDLVLASGSQDRFIRLWRIHHGHNLPDQSANSSELLMGKSLSNKAHRFIVGDSPYSVTFEALLVGHEDWIYRVTWRRNLLHNTLSLLSASADNSLSIWEADEASGIWVCISRLGEATGMKGSSTATGSAGGFWTGLWSPDGASVATFSKSGSWRLWQRGTTDESWDQRHAATGHIREVTGISWEPNGKYLLSTSLDQTTRLYARWATSKHYSWHEFSRPQIHGYDINCITTTGQFQFVTGADEKLLRVFSEPKGVAQILSELCLIQQDGWEALPDLASQPVLGLSNKIMNPSGTGQVDADESNQMDNKSDDKPDQPSTLNAPPFDDLLSRQTLWPEMEKLYGHGYEISTVACSHDGQILATACKASSLAHAVVRFYETKNWRQLKPPLEAHSLTVTRMAFSQDDKYLLTVGRDRQWTVLERLQETTEESQAPYKFRQVSAKAHSRIIWDGKWAPDNANRLFATASRDKSVKMWTLSENGDNEEAEWSCSTVLKFDEPVTALDFASQVIDVVTGDIGTERLSILAVGLESGACHILKASMDRLTIWTQVVIMHQLIQPDKAITQVAWKPSSNKKENSQFLEFAVCSEDSSTRIYEFSL